MQGAEIEERMEMDFDESGGDSPDEFALLRQYRDTQDPKIRDLIFIRYQGIVDMVVRKYLASAEREDLIQVGYIGLLAAIERFQLEKGFRFSTYASHCIDGEIRHFLRDKSESIRRPRWIRHLSSRVAAFLEGYLQKYQRLPTVTEISEGLNLAPEGVRSILRAKRPASLDEGDSNEALKNSVHSLRAESFRLPIEDRIAISEAFEMLLDLERKIIYLFFVQDFSQKEISKKLSLPPRKVSRLMQKALSHLRGHLLEEESKQKKE